MSKLQEFLKDPDLSNKSIGFINALVAEISRSKNMTNAQMHGCAFTGWQCFHCGEIFETVGGATDHFGITPDKEPGCLIKVRLGDERGLLMELRKVEAERDTLQYQISNESTEADLKIQSLQSDHQIALRREEEKGYAKGLHDGALLSVDGETIYQYRHAGQHYIESWIECDKKMFEHLTGDKHFVTRKLFTQPQPIESTELQSLADKVVIANATGSEDIFLEAVRDLLAGVRALKTPATETGA